MLMTSKTYCGNLLWHLNLLAFGKQVMTAVLMCLAIACAFPLLAESGAAWQQADFAAELYRHATKNPGENVVISPWSVANLFALLQTGARGGTAKGISSALRLGALGDGSFSAAKTFREARADLACATNRDVVLELSDSLWLATGFRINPEFAALAGDAFDAEIRSTEMGAKGRTTINAFVKDRTHGRIENLIEPPVLNSRDTCLVAVDTVYLKAQWQVPFMKSATRERDFHAADGDSKAPFLHSAHHVEILDAPECAALRLPYRSSTLEMLVVLPSGSNTLAEVEAKLSAKWLDRLAAAPWRGRADIALPKFDLGSEHDLKPILAPMGMDAAFDPIRADFGNIAPGRLYIGTAMQKANVTVDEEGTEASAAAYAVMERGGVRRLRSFIADRPFLFLIRETRTGMVLFLGRVAKP